MANTFLTASQITREGARVLHESLNFIGNVNRDYDDRYGIEGAKIGDSLKIRLPAQFVVRSGMNFVNQDITEQSVTLQVNNVKGVDFTLSSLDLTLSLDNFSDKILRPAMSQLAAAIEADVLAGVMPDIYNNVGTPGTTPNSLSVPLQARRKLRENLAPATDRSLLITPNTNVTMVDALKGLFQDSKSVSKQYLEGMIGRTAGFDWYESTLMPSFTVGNKVAGVTVNGAGQTGTTLNIGGVAAADTFKRGQPFTIAGVFMVHPETKAVTGVLQQFALTADATMAGATGSITMSPGIVTSGAMQNVSASPANSAAITLVGAASTTYWQNLAFHKDAFTFATADLVLPKGVDMAAREVQDGISLSFVRDFDATTRNFISRFDVLYGYKTIRPQLACRMWE